MLTTYVPMADAVEVAEILNNVDIGHVASTVHSLLKEMHAETPCYLRDHPYYKMWVGHAPALAAYGLAMCDEIRKRDRFETRDAREVFEAVEEGIRQHLEYATAADYTLTYPQWWGDVELHLAHQSELVRRYPGHYMKYFPDIPMTIAPFWPEA